MDHKGLHISRLVFRILALLLLVVALSIWLAWLTHDAGLYRWLEAGLEFLNPRERQVLAALFAFFPIFAVWVILTLILRSYTDMPRLHEDLAVLRDGAALREQMAAQRQHQDLMLALPADLPVRQRFFRQMGWVGIGVGAGSWGLTWLIWHLSGQLFPLLLAVGLVGLLGGGLSVITGYPFLFDHHKVQALAGITRRLSLGMLVVILVGLAVLCIVDAWR